MNTKKVSVIISNRNDVSMLVVTIRSCIEELKPLGEGQGEIVIVDNSDPETYNKLNGALPTGYIREGVLKIYRQDFPCIFTARETAVSKAEGKYVLCLDSHMIVGRNMILNLVDFMDRHSDDKTLGFAHPPINWAHQHERNARHDRDMSTCELGNWGAAYKYEQTITWKGMPWMCRRNWFLNKDTGLGGYGALAEHKLSWGGGDMHIGIKPWLLGFKNWAVPTRAGIHIGPFPSIDQRIGKHSTIVSKVGSNDRYRLWSVSGQGPHALGFLVSCYVLGGEPMMRRNKAAIQRRFNRYIDIDKEWKTAMAYGAHEKAWLDSRKVMSFERMLATRPWDEMPLNSVRGTVAGAR